MSDKTTRTRCKGLTRSGKKCRRYARPGSEYCRDHGPAEEGPPSEEPSAEMAEPELDQDLKRLAAELDNLIERVRTLTPGYTPPPFSPQRLLALIERNLEKLSPELRLGILERLKKAIGEDMFDVDTWKGIWTMLNYSLEYQGDLLKHRLTGEYETDEWGLDWEFLETVRPFFEFLYKTYWRVQTNGMENVPDEGRALLVANHSGQLPWDGAMVGTAIYLEHPAKRLVRSLYAAWFPALPFLSSTLVKLGQVLATEENAIRLLAQDNLVAVFPEGYKGVGKLFKDRYRLARFGRGGFVRMVQNMQMERV